MKIRPLPGIDLARIAVRPLDRQRAELEAMKGGRPPYSYEPMRRSTLDLLNIQAGPLAEVASTPWEKIEEAVRRNSKHPDEAKANIGVAKALFD